MELYIPKERLDRDPTTGRFNKGHKTHNRGKKAYEYMTPEGLAKSLWIGRKNLKPNKNLGGHNKKAVIAMTDEGRVAISRITNREKDFYVESILFKEL